MSTIYVMCPKCESNLRVRIKPNEVIQIDEARKLRIRFADRVVDHECKNKTGETDVHRQPRTGNCNNCGKFIGPDRWLCAKCKKAKQ